MLIPKLNITFLPIKTVHGIPTVINEFARAPDHSRNRQAYYLQPWAKLSNSCVAYQNKDQRKKNTIMTARLPWKMHPKSWEVDRSLQKWTDSKHLLLTRECYQQGLFLWASAWISARSSYNPCLRTCLWQKVWKNVQRRRQDSPIKLSKLPCIHNFSAPIPLTSGIKA